MMFTIAIDGPAASGKSTTAGLVANKLGFERIDSGLLYRGVTYLIDKHFTGQFDLSNEEVKNFVKFIELLQSKTRIFYKNEDITEALRTPLVDSKVGIVAKELYIREKVHQLQHSYIKASTSKGIVIDGRDIGTVVLPNAFIKFFITARSTTRAKRRSSQTGLEFNEVLAELEKRDQADISRKYGPLRQAEDAILIENDDISLEETSNLVVEHFHKKKESLWRKGAIFGE